MFKNGENLMPVSNYFPWLSSGQIPKYIYKEQSKYPIKPSPGRTSFNSPVAFFYYKDYDSDFPKLTEKHEICF